MLIMQLNIWGGRLIEQVKKLIQFNDPDVLCLQEVFDSPEGETWFFDNLQELQRICPGMNIRTAPVWETKFMGKRISHGNVIMSKHEITRGSTVFTNLQYKEDFKYEVDDYNIRNFQHAVIDNKGNEINIINHHGYHSWTSKLGDSNTTRQMEMIASYISTLHGPTILCGDLNLFPESASLLPIHKLLRNLCIEHNVTNTRNFLAKHPPHVCDYIFVSRDVSVRKFWVTDEIVSDHAALFVEIDGF